jgi:predicted nucleic acid-binding protein
MLIVCDSSALVALALCGHLDLLDAIYGQVLIPRTVFDESTFPGKPGAESIAAWAEGKVAEITDTEAALAFGGLLDKGEADAITLYLERKADTLLIDEKKGRKVAKVYGLNVKGSMGVLLAGKEKGLVEAIRPCVDILRHSTIRISPEIYRLALRAVDEDACGI